MQIISRETLRNLITQTPEPCISIYMPTHRTGQEVRQDPIRFKNLLKEAEHQLKHNNFKDREIERLLGPAKELLDDPFFWNHQSDGLAVFLSENNFIHFRLPYLFDESVVVSNSFHLKQLIPIVSNNGQFYLLALNLSHLKLYQVTRFKISEIMLEDVPTSLEEALKHDVFEKQIQFHTEASSGRGDRPAMFHGQGVSKDDLLNKKYIQQFFHMVSRAVQKHLREQTVPLLMMGVEYLLPIYRETNKYPHLVERGIDKDPHGMKPEELQETAWKVMEPVFKKDEDHAIEKFRNLSESETVSADVEEIIASAYQGRVESLFIDQTQQRWGFFDPNSQEIKFSEKEELGHIDLLDAAAVQTILNSGNVFAFEAGNVPADSPIAAIFRY